MAQASPIINSFVAGELSPRLAGRTDIQQYYQSAAELLNMLVEFYGGAKKAPGTYFVNEVKDSDLSTRLIKFVFSDTQAYILEFGNLYIRFYKDDATTGKGGAILETHKDISGIVVATGVITATSHGFSDGDEVYIDEITTTTELNGKRFIIANKTTHTFTLTDIDGIPIDTTDYTTYGTGGGEVSRVYTLTSGVDYLTAELFELQFAQTADILYITHPDHPQAKLTRTAHTSWTLTDIDYSTGEARPAMMADNITTTEIDPSDVTGSITLTATSAIFDITHEGSIWRIKNAYVKITDVASGGLKTTATATVLYGVNISDHVTTTDWAEGAWSGYRGYPRAVTISEDRLIYGYTVSQPQTIWGSGTGAYDTFELGTTDADGIEFTADTNQVEVINWLFPANEILVGTPSGVSSLGTGSETLALTATTGRMKKKVRDGASSILPQAIGNNIFYWQKYNRILREYVYSLDQDNYLANDATVISDHISESGIVDMDYQQSPLNILWCVRADGKLAVFTRQIEQKVSAWTLHDTQGFYESVAVIPKDSYDEVWFIVRRTIGGVKRRYIEYMVAPEFTDLEDAFFVHSGLTLDNPKTITNITQANPVVVTCDNDFTAGDIVKIRGLVEREAGAIPEKTIDPMEYATNALAQAAYVTNATLRSNADIDDEDMVDITDWTDGDSGSGDSFQATVVGRSCMQLNTGATLGSEAKRTQDVGSFGARTIFSIVASCEAIGTRVQNDCLGFVAYNGAIKLQITFASDGLYIFDGAAWNEVGTDLVVIDEWQEWTFDVNWVAQTVDVYLGGVLKASGVDCSAASATANGTTVFSLYNATTASRVAYIDWFKAGSDFILQSYSESTIKTQGSYALKAVAAITDSLNKTLTRTIAVPLDLTDVDTITFDIYASRIGANIKIGIYDATVPTTTEKTYTVLVANTWETVTWDISAVANANKNAISKIIITILNADAANTFYIDNMFTVAKAAETVGMTELNNNRYIVAPGVSGTEFHLHDSVTGLDVDGTGYTAYDTGGEARECVNEVSGLNHLALQNVQVFADGEDHPDRTVSAAGVVTLDAYYGQVLIGLGYTGRIKTNDIEFFPGGATSQGKTKRVVSASVNLYKSLACKIGTASKMDDINVRDVALSDDERTPLFTGIKKIPFPSGFDVKKQVIIEQTKCLPLHVLSIVLEGEIN